MTYWIPKTWKGEADSYLYRGNRKVITAYYFLPYKGWLPHWMPIGDNLMQVPKCFIQLVTGERE